MQNAQWLPLMDYSTKYRVSVSTLRRRIKAEDIQFKLKDGKYFIVDEPIQSNLKEHRPSLNSANLSNSNKMESAKVIGSNLSMTANNSQSSSDEPILTAANRLLSELKKAYTLILQEKEEQIVSLKEEVADLKTLVKVLENENDRLKALYTQQASAQF